MLSFLVYVMGGLFTACLFGVLKGVYPELWEDSEEVSVPFIIIGTLIWPLGLFALTLIAAYLLGRKITGAPKPKR